MTPDQAAEFACPVARTFAEKIGPNCQGPKCILWRWIPIAAADPRFVSAVKNEMKRLAVEKGKTNHVSFHKEAVRNVHADPEAHGVPSAPERGFCGLGGCP